MLVWENCSAPLLATDFCYFLIHDGLPSLIEISVMGIIINEETPDYKTHKVIRLR